MTLEESEWVFSERGNGTFDLFHYHPLGTRHKVLPGRKCYKCQKVAPDYIQFQWKLLGVPNYTRLIEYLSCEGSLDIWNKF